MAYRLFQAASVAAVLVACAAGFASAQSQPQSSVPRPPPPRRGLPDLTFRTTWLELPGSTVHVKAVHNGRPYLACFTVVNIGMSPSGPFRVAGGGLGITYNPYQDHASLAPGAGRQGCLKYPTTPGPGSYKLGIEADSQHVVHESNEANNEAVIPVVVIP